MALKIVADLVMEIVKKLPASSLARFRCLSRQILTMIGSRGTVFPSQPQLYLTIPIEHDQHQIVSFSTSSSPSEDPKKHCIGREELVTLRGLILYRITFGEHPCACIYNPTTGQIVELPSLTDMDAYLEMNEYAEVLFFGFDPVRNEYKVLYTCLSLSRQQKNFVIVIKSKPSWRRVEFNRPHIPTWRRVEFNRPHVPTTKGLCIKGTIYYLAFRVDEALELRNSVITFEVGSEVFNEIALPEEVSRYSKRDFVDLDLIEYEEKPTVFRHKPHESDMWILEEEGLGTWSKKTLSLQPSSYVYFFGGFKVCGTSSQGEVVLKPNSSQIDHILYYDLSKNKVRRVDIGGSISEAPGDLVYMDTVNIITFEEI